MILPHSLPQHAHPEADEPTLPSAEPNLSVVLISLFKGVLYREQDERLWSQLMQLQARVRDYVSVLNLELALDEAEGYAFLRNLPDPPEDEPTARLPRLVARRPLSFPVSLLLALLRRKLAEADAGDDDPRVVMTRDSLVESLRVFLPEQTNESRLLDQIDSYINKVVELGFLRRLKPPAGRQAEPDVFEVRRILKAFVDAQWLGDFDERLAAYQAALAGEGEGDTAAGKGRRGGRQRSRDDDPDTLTDNDDTSLFDDD